MFKIRKFKEELLMLAGILDGRRAFTGPRNVQIDLTNRCNNNCICCWCHSPLLKEKAMPLEERKLMLPFKLLKELIDDLYSMGCIEIYLTGGGEPFMHPNIMEVIKYIKDKNLRCDMSTNFSLINKNIVEKLIDWSVDHINVSLWAATPETYSKTHPNKNKKDFIRIKKILVLLSKLKQEKRKRKPVINIYNVISKLNYCEVEKMFDFAYEVGANTVSFTPMDPIPGKTDILLLNEKERNELINKYNKAVNKWKKNYAPKLKLVGHEQFLRRISNRNSTKGKYDTDIIDHIPCYAGWSFVRILANGDVDPCLKSVKAPLGNIYKKRFKEIWYSEKYNIFREKAKNVKKTDPYFLNIDCYGSCDNLELNLAIHNKICSMSKIEQFMTYLMRNMIKFIK